MWPDLGSSTLQRSLRGYGWRSMHVDTAQITINVTAVALQLLNLRRPTVQCIHSNLRCFRCRCLRWGLESFTPTERCPMHNPGFDVVSRRILTQGRLSFSDFGVLDLPSERRQANWCAFRHVREQKPSPLLWSGGSRVFGTGVRLSRILERRVDRHRFSCFTS